MKTWIVILVAPHVILLSLGLLHEIALGVVHIDGIAWFLAITLTVFQLAIAGAMMVPS